MIVLDATFVTRRRSPRSRANYGFSPGGSAWVVNAYLIAFGGVLLLAGRLGDLIGRRRVPGRSGCVHERAADLWFGPADVLVAARFVQGSAGR